MKALKLFSEMTKRVESNYSDLADFNNWSLGKCDLEFEYEDISYTIDYSVIGFRQLTVSNIFAHEYNDNYGEPGNTKDLYYEVSFDKDIKAFLSAGFEKLLPLCYDELEAEREQKEREDYEDEQYNEEIRRTEESLGY